MCSEEVGLAAPTEALASFEPFVQWLLSASLQDMASIPDKIFLGFQVTSEEDGSKDVDKLNIEKQKRPLFESTCSARLALAEAEGSSEAAWDKLSCTLREWSTLGEKLLALREERDESSKYIELLERRIIKLLQDRDLAIAETYTIEKQIEDAEYFKVRQKRRQQLQEEELRKARVTSTLRKLLLRQGSGDSNIPASPAISPATLKFTEQDVQRLHKELADTKVSAAVAKAEQDERRYAVRRAERQCIELKLALAQARAEEDDLQVSLQQLTRARRNSVDNLQQISLFSSTSLPLHPPPAPTAANRARAFSLLMYTGYLLLKSLELLLGHNIMDEESGEEQDPCSFIWIEGDSLAPPCQSDHDVVSKIVKIARLTRDDFLFDLGCGDGRICIEAAKRFGSRAHGVEIEEFLVKRFRELIVANNLQQLISVSHGDLLEEDLSQATVIVTYLLPDAMDQLTSKFIKLLSQSDKDVRIICNTWGIRGLTPAERHDVGPYKNVPLFVYKSTAELPRPQTTNSISTRLSETQDD